MNQHEYIPGWVQAMETGLINGRPFSHHTVSQYCFHIERFLSLYGEVTMETLRQALLDIPIEQFGKRDKVYKAIVCFLKYLLDREYPIDKALIDKEGELSRKILNKLRPKRHVPPIRKVINEQELQALIDACETFLDRLIVIFLSATGLRATEACSLNLEDLNLEGGFLIVRKGKWGKTRRVGLSQPVIQVIQGYLMTRQETSPTSPLMVNAKGERMDRFGLSQRLERLGKKAGGIQAPPHALRRAFVTINAKKGRPLVYLQRACGHSSITTTESYCQIQEQEVIDAMREWN